MNRPSGLLITALAASAVLTVPVAAASTVTASPVHTAAVADGPDVDEVQHGFSWG